MINNEKEFGSISVETNGRKKNKYSRILISDTKDNSHKCANDIINRNNKIKIDDIIKIDNKNKNQIIPKLINIDCKDITVAELIKYVISFINLITLNEQFTIYNILYEENISLDSKYIIYKLFSLEGCEKLRNKLGIPYISTNSKGKYDNINPLLEKIAFYINQLDNDELDHFVIALSRYKLGQSQVKRNKIVKDDKTVLEKQENEVPEEPKTVIVEEEYDDSDDDIEQI